MEENERKSFMFYLSWLDSINEMEPDELKRFINNLCNYHLGLDVELETKDDRKNWNFVKPALVVNDEKWRKKAESSRTNGKLGGAPVGNQNARRTEIIKTTQINPNNLLIDNSKKLMDKCERITGNSELVIDNSKLKSDNWQESIVESKLENDNIVKVDSVINNIENELALIEDIESLKDFNWRGMTEVTNKEKDIITSCQLGQYILQQVKANNFENIKQKIDIHNLENIENLVEKYIIARDRSYRITEALDQKLEEKNKFSTDNKDDL